MSAAAQELTGLRTKHAQNVSVIEQLSSHIAERKGMIAPLKQRQDALREELYDLHHPAPGAPRLTDDQRDRKAATIREQINDTGREQSNLERLNNEDGRTIHCRRANNADIEKRISVIERTLEHEKLLASINSGLSDQWKGKLAPALRSVTSARRSLKAAEKRLSAAEADAENYHARADEADEEIRKLSSNLVPDRVAELLGEKKTVSAPDIQDLRLSAVALRQIAKDSDEEVANCEDDVEAAKSQLNAAIAEAALVEHDIALSTVDFHIFALSRALVEGVAAGSVVRQFGGTLPGFNSYGPAGALIEAFQKFTWPTDIHHHGLRPQTVVNHAGRHPDVPDAVAALRSKLEIDA